jgi:hypothetical protein
MNDDFLSAKVEAFKKFPDSQSVIARFTFFNSEGITPNQLGFTKVFPQFYENMLTVKIPVWTSSIMFRRKFLIEIGECFDENLKRLQEYEFFSRIFIKYPHKKKLLNKSLSLQREHENTKTVAFNEKKDREMYRTFYDANRKIVSLLMIENKFTNNLENFFYQNHLKYISYSKKQKYNDIAEELNDLVTDYLKYNNSSFRLFRYRVGYFFFKYIPIENFFLVFEVKNPVLRFLRRNINRVYKLFFKGEYLRKLRKKNRVKT